MSRVTLILTDALLHFLWQGAVIGLVTISILNALRSARASTRYAVLCASFTLLIAAPIGTVVLLALAPSSYGRATNAIRA